MRSRKFTIKDLVKRKIHENEVPLTKTISERNWSQFKPEKRKSSISNKPFCNKFDILFPFILYIWIPKMDFISSVSKNEHTF